MKPSIPTQHTNEQLNNFYNDLLVTDGPKGEKKRNQRDDPNKKTGVIFSTIIKSFMTLWGFDSKHELPDSELDGLPILTEAHFRNNIHLLTGSESDCNFPYFGKLLYLYLAKGRDQIKITLMRFFEGLAPFAYEDNK